MVHCNATLWYRTSYPYIYNLTIDLLLLLELYLSLFHSTVESFDVSLYILLAEARILQQQPCKALFWNGWQSSGILGEVSTVKESHDFWERGKKGRQCSSEVVKYVFLLGMNSRRIALTSHN